MGATDRIPFVLEAIRAALRLAADAPPCVAAEELSRQAESLRLEVEGWRVQAPRTEERERVLRQVLGLHGQAARLARGQVAEVRAAPSSSQGASEGDAHERPTVPPPFNVEAFARAASAPAAEEEGAVGSGPPTVRRLSGARDDDTPGADDVIPVTVDEEIDHALAELGRSGDPPAAALTSDRPELMQRAIDDPVAEMIACYSLGDYTGAIGVADLILAEDPSHAAAAECRANARAALESIYAARLGSFERVPVVALAPAEVDCLSIDHRAGFLLSLIDGSCSVETILDVCGMPRLDALRIFHELSQRGAVAFR